MFRVVLPNELTGPNAVQRKCFIWEEKPPQTLGLVAPRVGPFVWSCVPFEMTFFFFFYVDGMWERWGHFKFKACGSSVTLRKADRYSVESCCGDINIYNIHL